MARASIWLRRFDRDAAFIIERNFLFDGKKQRPGSIFDKALASTRRLRQLYENRQIRHANSGEAPVDIALTAAHLLDEAGDPVAVPDGDLAADLAAGGSPVEAPAPLVVDPDAPSTFGETAASPLIAKHIGRGRYALTRDGERIDDALYDSKAEAEAAIPMD